MYKNKSILITGGTGTLGKKLIETFLKSEYDFERIIVYSRDEQKQFKLQNKYPKKKYPQLRFFIGDIRDKSRLSRALNDVHYVIHTAAMKHVHIAEYNPDECVKTNIGGASNLIECCIDKNSTVEKVVALSTDKACAPVNLYGATKLASDKMFIAANLFRGKRNVMFNVVRYGNVFGSNGSIVPFLIKHLKSNDFIPITSEKMTRFNISIENAVEMVIHALDKGVGGELFVPKLKSYNIMDLANAFDQSITKKIVGIRPGEKIHEEMITFSDSMNSYDCGKYFIIMPPNLDIEHEKKFLETYEGEISKIEEPFSYNSGENTQWESTQTLNELIKNYKQNYHE